MGPGHEYCPSTVLRSSLELQSGVNTFPSGGRIVSPPPTLHEMHGSYCQGAGTCSWSSGRQGLFPRMRPSCGECSREGLVARCFLRMRSLAVTRQMSRVFPSRQTNTTTTVLHFRFVPPAVHQVPVIWFCFLASASCASPRERQLHHRLTPSRIFSTFSPSVSWMHMQQVVC